MNRTAIWIFSVFLSFGLSVYASTPVCEGIPNFKWIGQVGARNRPSAEKIFNVRDFGAVADTTILSTKSIQAAIDSCSSRGGGLVTFAPGNYLTGSLFLKSGVNLNIPEGVQLFGSQDISQYPAIDTRVAGIEMKWPAALINALDQENVAISGKGKVFGQGKVFWDKYWAMRPEYDKKGLRWIVDYDCQRPQLVLIQNCKNVSLTETSFFEAGFWTIHILYSQFVTVDGVTVNNAGHGPSTDGIDIDSSNHILIQNCDISCNDDDFCLKAGRDADGLRVNRPTEYVVIRNCITRQGHGVVTCGSETSGSIRHIVAYNIKALGTMIGLRFKSSLNRGGVVEDIYFSNINMQNVSEPLQVNLNWDPAYSYTKVPEGYVWDSIPAYWKVMLTPVSPLKLGIPKFRNIHFTNIQANSCGVAITCDGAEVSTIEDLYMKNVHIMAKNAGHINWAKNWKLKNVSIGGENGQKVELKNTLNVPLYK